MNRASNSIQPSSYTRSDRYIKNRLAQIEMQARSTRNVVLQHGLQLDHSAIIALHTTCDIYPFIAYHRHTLGEKDQAVITHTYPEAQVRTFRFNFPTFPFAWSESVSNTMAQRQPVNRLSIGGCAIMLARLLPAIRAETSSPEFSFIVPTRDTALPMGQTFTATWWVSSNTMSL